MILNKCPIFGYSKNLYSLATLAITNQIKPNFTTEPIDPCGMFSSFLTFAISTTLHSTRRCNSLNEMNFQVLSFFIVTHHNCYSTTDR